MADLETGRGWHVMSHLWSKVTDDGRVMSD